jgi:hypothetical protein
MNMSERVKIPFDRLEWGRQCSLDNNCESQICQETQYFGQKRCAILRGSLGPAILQCTAELLGDTLKPPLYRFLQISNLKDFTSFYNKIFPKVLIEKCVGPESWKVVIQSCIQSLMASLMGDGFKATTSVSQIRNYSMKAFTLKSVLREATLPLFHAKIELVLKFAITYHHLK